jgi:hypothetical protein
LIDKIIGLLVIVDIAAGFLAEQGSTLFVSLSLRYVLYITDEANAIC